MEACTSNANVVMPMDGENSMQNSDGISTIPNMHEIGSAIDTVNTLPAAQASNPVNEISPDLPSFSRKRAKHESNVRI